MLGFAPSHYAHHVPDATALVRDDLVAHPTRRRWTWLAGQRYFAVERD